MNDAYARVEAAFQQLLGRSVATRMAALEEEFADDTELRSQVSDLLAAHDEVAGFLERAAFSQHRDDEAGRRIAHYRLIERLGEGGFGVVWRAEQEAPVRREVALKIVKPGMDTREVLARFAAERQALAIMDHPHIAQVFDAGATEAGRPYFVMELVPGEPLTRYCDAHQLPIADRLGLFLQVCRAVQHAHQKGVIHRDLKPANLLVAARDGIATVKVIDFGIAKAVAEPLTAATLATHFGQALGTPLYMAPEQLATGATDVDTRADIYALGVILFDLLTGLLPFASSERGAAALEEMRRRVCGEEPPRPSQVLRCLPTDANAAIAADRGTNPAALARALRGDLDWIVLKCLEKDRDRRYAAAHDLALDLERHLEQRPVSAAAPSLRYTAAKLVRRHRTALAIAAAIVVLLVGGTVVSTREAMRARRAERHAAELLVQVEEENRAKLQAWSARQDALSERERALLAAEEASQRAHLGESQARAAEADTRAFGDWLVSRVLSVARSSDAPGGLGVGVTVVQALEAAEKSIERDFEDRPLAEARTRRAIGDTWRHLGRYAAAEVHLRLSAQRFADALGPDHRETRSARHQLGGVLHDLGRTREAIALLEPLAELQQAGHAPELLHAPTPVDLLVNAYQAAGWQEKARTLAAGSGASVPGHEPASLAAMERLATLHREAGTHGEAINLLQRAHTLRAETNGADAPETIAALLTLSACCAEARRFGEAVDYCESAVRTRERVLGERHRETLAARAQLGGILFHAHQISRALEGYESLLPLCEHVLGESDPETLAVTSGFAAAQLARGNAARAVQLYERVLASCIQHRGMTHPDTDRARMDVAAARQAAGDFPRAVLLLYDLLERRRSSHGPEHRDTLHCMHLLAGAYVAAGRKEAALPLYTRVIAQRRSLFGPEHRDTLASLLGLGRLHAVREDHPAALALFQQIQAASRRMLGAGAPETIASTAEIGRVFLAQSRFREAVTPLSEAVAAYSANGDESADALDVMRSLARALDATDAKERATLLLEEMLPMLERMRGSDSDETLAHLRALAARHIGAARYVEAGHYSETVLNRQLARLGPAHADTLGSLHQIGVLCQLTGEGARARTFLQEAYTRRRAALGVHRDTVASADRFGHCQLLAGDSEGAARVFREGLEMARRLAPWPQDDPTVALLAHHLAAALLSLGRVEEALPPARDAHWMYRRNPAWENRDAQQASRVFSASLSASRVTERGRENVARSIPVCWDWAPTPP